MRQPDIKKNFLLSILYQVITVMIPFVTTPYISRVLGVEGVGIYSYTHSIELYFSMFASLGTVSYGAREVARNRDDSRKRSQLFWEIELLTVITTAVCLVIWGIWILVHVEYRIYYIILTFSLLAVLFDISWFYKGLEQFQYIIVFNICFKVLGMLAIFWFVKEKDDVGIYIAIMSLSVLLGNLGMWIYCPKFICKPDMESFQISGHFKETIIYFIPSIATSVYTVLDKTLIGAITKDVNESGYYEQAVKIINVGKTFAFVALNGVLESRMSYLYACEKDREIRKKIYQSMEYILFVGIGFCFGIFGVADRFVPIFFGTGYDKVADLLKMLSPLVIIIGVSNCLGAHYYTPAGRRGESAKYIVVGAGVNLFLNVLFIPRYESYGAVAASIFAELVITVLYIKNCHGYLTALQLLRLGWKKLMAGAGMLLVIEGINGEGAGSIVKVIGEILIGLAVYGIILLCLRDKAIYELLRNVSRRNGNG